ncbi:50S ribosomal protein LX [candidate division MSBL1 archaeon SCGC-AAA261O19]|uniref:Large ribosomal subunit protein eL20 n=1 Tax=candidate division MSBL1 archaeon SCGC-AAA261O19 TaxID=1698277 RepID=A0A133V975_9EURY|nr:50S ribosomal protein LX [candidate division MSBL1 archaeon SCGC-AAA261O19]
MVKTFRITGWFKHNDREQKFTKEMRAHSKDNVIERVYSDIGSRHGVKRNLIQIGKIEEIKPEEAEDPRIRALAGVE